MGAVINCGPQDRSQYCVLLALANYADDFGFCFPQISTIAANSRCDYKTATRQIAELEAGGWLYVARKVLNGKSNIYILNLAKLGVTVPVDAKRNPVFMRLLKTSAGAMTPIFAPEKSTGAGPISTDNPQGVQRASAQSQRAFEGGSTGIACPTNRYNRHDSEPSGTINEVEPSPLPPTGGENEKLEAHVPEAAPPADDELVERAASLHLVQAWERMRGALKQEVGSISHRNFAALDPDQPSDFDTCFRDWWFAGIQRQGTLWTFRTHAPDVAVAVRGVEKYAKRLDQIIRAYFPIPSAHRVHFSVQLPDTRTA